MPQLPPPRNLKAKRDKNGWHWTIPSDGVEYPEITVWWSRGPRKRVKDARGTAVTKMDEYVLIRQSDGGKRADVVFASQGQLYDVVHALSQALEKP